MPILRASRGAARQGTPELRAGRPPLAVLVPLAVRAPSQRTPQTRAAGFPCASVPIERDEPCLGTRECQSDLLEPLPQHVGEAFRICVVFEPAPTIVCVAPQTRFASTVPFDHVGKPPIAPVGQEHLGAYG